MDSLFCVKINNWPIRGWISHKMAMQVCGLVEILLLVVFKCSDVYLGFVYVGVVATLYYVVILIIRLSCVNDIDYSVLCRTTVSLPSAGASK